MKFISAKEIKEKEKKDIIKIGNDIFDNFIEFERGYLYEFFGPTTAGKTILSLFLTKRFSENNKVLYITTELRVNKLIEIIKNINEEWKEDNVFFYEIIPKPEDLHDATLRELYSVLKELEKSRENFDVVIIDSLGNILRQMSELGELAERQEKFKRILTRMKKLAEDRKMVFIFTNQVYSLINKNDNINTNDVNSLGGHIFWHLVNYRVEIKKLSSKVRLLKIVKALNRPETSIKLILENNDSKVKLKFLKKIS